LVVIWTSDWVPFVSVFIKCKQTKHFLNYLVPVR